MKSALIPSSRTIAFYVLQSGPISWTPDFQLPAGISIWIFLRHHSQQQTPDVSFSLLSPLHNQQLNSSRHWRQKQNCCPLSIRLMPCLLDEMPIILMFCLSMLLKIKLLATKAFLSLCCFFFFLAGGRFPSLGHIYFSLLYFPLFFSRPFLSLQYNSMNVGFLFVFFKDASRVLRMAFSMKMA